MKRPTNNYLYQTTKKQPPKDEGEFEKLYNNLTSEYAEVRKTYLELIDEFNELAEMYEELEDRLEKLSKGDSYYYEIVKEVLSSYGTIGKKIQAEIDSKI